MQLLLLLAFVLAANAAGCHASSPRQASSSSPHHKQQPLCDYVGVERG